MKMVSLDATDRQLLYALDQDARRPYSELARHAGVSKEVARYRVMQLQTQGVIRQYFTIFDVARLGFTNRKAFVKLRNVDEREERRLIAWLKRSPHVAWLAACDGPYDLAFGMLAQDIEKFAEQMEDLDNRFGDLFLERDIAPIVQGQYFHRDYLIGKSSGTARDFTFGSVPGRPSLDDVDWKLMRQLGKDARTPIVELAHQAGTTADLAARRLKRLEQSGAIQNHILVLDNPVLSQSHYKVLIRLQSGEKKRRDELTAFCRTHPNIIYNVRTFGPWEFEIDLEVPDAEAFRTIMRQLKKTFSDIIRDYSYVLIHRVHKYNFCPGSPEERTS